MTVLRRISTILMGAATLIGSASVCSLPLISAGGNETPAPTAQATQAAAPNGAAGKLVVTVGKSLIIDSPMNIQRVSVANGELMEAVAVNPKEVLINGKAPGETSLIIWQQGGTRLLY